MANGIRLLPEVIRSRDSISFTGSYQTLGSALTKQCRILKFVNDSNVDVMISWDGTNNHDFLPAGSAAIYDISANKQDISGFGQLSVASQTQFYVSGSAGGGNLGSVYLVALYTN